MTVASILHRIHILYGCYGGMTVTGSLLSPLTPTASHDDISHNPLNGMQFPFMS
jgi:hypothetical protein